MAAGLALVAVLATPVVATAKSGGGGGGWGGKGLSGFGAGWGNRGAFRNRAYPWAGGYMVYEPNSYYAPASPGGDVVEKIVMPPEPPRALTCHRSQETKSVPTEDGSMKDILIVRC
jgi:hypothetical protein